MAHLLTEYLRSASRRPFVWGKSDCFLFFVDWIACATGRDPMADWRGRYDTERQARRIMVEYGGPVQTIETHLAPHGFARVERAKPGDVGLVRVGLKRWHERMILVPAGAICVRNNIWAVKARDMMLYQPFPIVAAWGLPA